MKNAIFTLLIMLLKSATVQCTVQECAYNFLSAGFDLGDFDNYDNWFNDDSTMTLAQAGTYQGSDSIKEYVKFAYLTSPYIQLDYKLNYTEELSAFDPEKGICSFRTINKNRMQLSEMGNWATFDFMVMYRVDWDYSIGKISHVSVYYWTDMLLKFFGNLDTPAVSEYVCGTMQANCGDTWAENGLESIEGCTTRLDALPVSEGDGYVDGNSKGCRVLHAVFASENSDHCPHLSFEPMTDVNGKIKCQVSANNSPDELFNDVDFAALELTAEEFGFGSGETLQDITCDSAVDCPDTSWTIPDRDDGFGVNTTCSVDGRRSLLFGSVASGICTVE